MSPRLAAYGLAGAALLAALIGVGLKVRAWHRDSLRLPAVEARLEAEVKGRQALERSLVDQVARNRKQEHDTNEALARAGAAARDLADGLQRYYAGLSRPQCAAPAAAGGADAARGEPADGREVEAAVAAHLEACGRDAERLNGLQTWVRGLPARCVFEGGD